MENLHIDELLIIQEKIQESFNFHVMKQYDFSKRIITQILLNLYHRTKILEQEYFRRKENTLAYEIQDGLQSEIERYIAERI